MMTFKGGENLLGEAEEEHLAPAQVFVTPPAVLEDRDSGEEDGGGDNGGELRVIVSDCWKGHVK